MTAQFPDEVVYEGELYSLVGVSGTGLFTPADFQMEPYSTCTACWRGYVMKYACVNDQLILDGMKINVDKRRSINGVKPKKADHLFKFCYENLGLKTKFTGTLLIAKDFIQEMYVHMGFQRPMSYRKVIELHVDKGDITAEKDLSSKMEEERGKDPYKDSQPRSRDKEDIEDWIVKTFSLDYESD